MDPATRAGLERARDLAHAQAEAALSTAAALDALLSGDAADPLLPVKSLADLWGVSDATALRRARKRGEFHHGKWFVRQSIARAA